jgi:hypothetical protein
MVIEALHRPQRSVRLRLAVALVAGSALLLALLARLAAAQSHAHDADVPRAAASAVDSAAHHMMDGHTPASNASLHVEMTPVRRATPADSARAAQVARTLRAALEKYRDTTAAVADGYRMFLPRLKEQKVYHFTNNWRAMQEGFRFEPTRPTSLLYKKSPDGRFMLIGAMYTAPKRFGPDKLDERVPLSIARWHKHVNWCIPKAGAEKRWLERIDGAPVFGPESPIATRAECEQVGGVFHPVIFGWMLHANVFVGDDPATIWGDEHAGHDMHAGMTTGTM